MGMMKTVFFDDYYHFQPCQNMPQHELGILSGNPEAVSKRLTNRSWKERGLKTSQLCYLVWHYLDLL